MQAQQQKQKTTPKPRLSVGEIVVAVINTSFSGMGWLGFDTLFKSPNSPYLLGGFLLGMSALGAGLSSVLTILSQRRMAVYAQSLAAVGIFSLGAVITWEVCRRETHVHKNDLLQIASLIVLALLFSWFAWFLKRMDESN